MPTRRRPACIFIYEHRVYFRDATGELWRVYDITVAPDQRGNPRRLPLTPPDNRAIYREFVSRSGECRRYILAAELSETPD